jgi:hypothetical protein
MQTGRLWNNVNKHHNYLALNVRQKTNKLKRTQRAGIRRDRSNRADRMLVRLDTGHFNHEHILDDEDFDVYKPEYSGVSQVWVECFTTVCRRRFRLSLPPPDVDTTLHESPKLPELIKNGNYYGQVISLLNTGACVKPNPEKDGNGAKPILEDRFLTDFTVLPIHLAILNRTRNTPVEFIEKIVSAYTDKEFLR